MTSHRNARRYPTFHSLLDEIHALILDNGSTAAARQPRSNMP